MKALKIPEATVMRLSVYSRYLGQLVHDGMLTVSSSEIAKGVGVSSAQVRKDLAYFGEFGTRGVGYNVQELYNHILRILGLNRNWNLVIVGAGKLGSALAVYKGFGDRGFNVMGIFDVDPARIGNSLGHLIVEPQELLEQRIKENYVQIGVVAVPAAFAQEVSDKMIRAGVKSILNFAPRVLKIPDRIILRNVDLSVNLEVLSFNLSLIEPRG
ncbi:MAG: redox-sensing transcriptional repressor Rex [Chitinophagales bacterium]